MSPARILGIVVAGLGAATVLGAGVVFARSERRLRDVPTVVAFVHAIPTDSASIARGEHIARTRGCFSCHGAQLEGHDFSDEWPESGTPVAPNLAKLARAESAAKIEAAIRHGVGHDGRALWSMPAFNFRHLRDEDVAGLIAFLRSQPVVDSPLPTPRHSWSLRWDVAFGGGQHMPEFVALVPPLITDPVQDSAGAEAEYLAMTTCNECHGFDLRGSFGGTPDLAIVAGYSPEEFARLMREGVARDGRKDMVLMSGAARNRFVHFRDDEVASLYGFLRTLAGRPVPSGVAWR